MSEHALISPSAAHQWIECPPSIRLEQQFQDIESEYAAEGTLAHAVGEVLIKRDLKLISPLQAVIKLTDELSKNKHYSRALERDAGFYRDYVLERYADALKRDKQAKIKIESKVDISYVMPGIFGRRDIAIITKDALEIIDLKYGKGIKVDAVDNPQQALYAIGSLEELPHSVSNVRITIYQPRLNHIDTWETTPEDLYLWADTVAIPAAKKAFDGVGDFKAGDHCRFCNAKPLCRAFYDYNMSIAQEEFINPELISESEMVDVILKAASFTSWIKAIKDYALAEAKKGKQWKGLKLGIRLRILKILRAWLTFRSMNQQ